MIIIRQDIKINTPLHQRKAFHIGMFKQCHEFSMPKSTYQIMLNCLIHSLLTTLTTTSRQRERERERDREREKGGGGRERQRKGERECVCACV